MTKGEREREGQPVGQTRYFHVPLITLIRFQFLFAHAARVSPFDPGCTFLFFPSFSSHTFFFFFFFFSFFLLFSSTPLHSTPLTPPSPYQTLSENGQRLHRRC